MLIYNGDYPVLHQVVKSYLLVIGRCRKVRSGKKTLLKMYKAIFDKFVNIFFYDNRLNEQQ